MHVPEISGTAARYSAPAVLDQHWQGIHRDLSTMLKDGQKLHNGTVHAAF
jgi:hypothetical protein